MIGAIIAMNEALDAQRRAKEAEEAARRAREEVRGVRKMRDAVQELYRNVIPAYVMQWDVIQMYV